ncbi:Inositol 2-dehydrogenase [Planctomycetes bacterium Poly30]|uniref:Inositol 2-dehydrogenase n=1 Tax=Saltatorellus ferox TaxID=2528018 RepID=A0A518ESV1_9BACT|nr:Inositol 2-dehydrogenase [Planctomycetes bacterium Poly30]
MTQPQDSPLHHAQPGGLPRRTLLRGAGVAAAASMMPSTFGRQGGAAGDAELRIALIGCGGRGTGAASQALRAAGNARLVTMADAFEDRMESSIQSLKNEHPGKIDVPAERKHVGFDAFKKAIDEDIDVVVMATPPGFRPAHFEYAVEKGRHVFMEKPVAVDGPGIRQVLAAADAAKAKNLCVGVGLQRHHSYKYQETIKAIEDGAIGRPVMARVYWNSAGVWVRPREADQTEMTYQMRNWYYFNWLCGDHIVEQHIHNLDVGNWMMGGVPVKAQGMGGRLVRTGKEYGEIYDHHAVEYTYENGAKMISQCRHMPGTKATVNEFGEGSEGAVDFGRGSITHYGGSKWRFEGQDSDHYQREHDVLFDAIRTGKEHNEAVNGAHATLTAILGRMCTYSGQEISWEKALNSTRRLSPDMDLDKLTWDTMPKSLPGKDGFYPIPMPGQYEII